jgi:hypothetical protein
MKYFFHAQTDKYRRTLKSLLIIVLMPLAAICVFCTVNIILNLGADSDEELVRLMLFIIAGTVFVGMVFCFSAAYVTDKKIRRHSRYTYLDILPCGVIYSLYAGEFVRYGEQKILRRLYYIPFKTLEKAERKPNTADCIVFSGEIREFFLSSEHLGYHVNGDGEMSFDNPELNERGFERLSILEISGRFGSAKPIEQSVLGIWEEYKNRPEKKPFDISEHIARRKSVHQRTSNPMLDAPSYDRKWQ